MKNILTISWLLLSVITASAQQIITAPLVPSGNPIGTGIDFSTKTSALYVQAATSIQNGAPWSIAFGAKSPGFPATETVFVSTNPINVAATSTGFRLSNVSLAADLGFGLEGYVRPYPAPTNCSDPSAICARSTRWSDGITHWYVLTFDGTRTRLWIDNIALDVSIPATSTYIPSTTYWQIGTAGAPIALTEFAYYPVALDSSAVAQLYFLNSNGYSPASGPLTQRLIYYPTSPGNCNTSGCSDASGNNNPGIFDNTPPTVAILTPASGANITGTQNLTASSTDTVQTSSVAWQLDGVLLSTQTVAPYTFAWNSAKYVDSASHVLTAIATNVGGLTASTSIPITTSNGVTAKSYFFANAGNDNLDCQSPATACATVPKANSLEYHGGDSIFWKAGDTWTNTTSWLRLCGPGVGGCTQNTYPGGAAFPMVLSTYGGGTCTAIAGVLTGCATFALSGTTVTEGVSLLGLSNLTMSNFNITGGSSTVLTPAAIDPGIFMDTASTNVTITNNRVVDFVIGIYWDGGSGNVTGAITNNWVGGSTPFATIDTGIWARFVGATQLTISGNYVKNVGGHSSGVVPGGSGNPILIADGATGVVSRFNVTDTFGANITTCGGPAGNWGYNSINITFEFNESFNGAQNPFLNIGCDWDAYDLDGGMQNSIVRYSYGHDNEGGGLTIFNEDVGVNHWQNNQLYYNIMENNGTGGAGGCIYIAGGNNLTSNSAAFNNTCYNHQPNANNKGILVAIGGNNDIKILNNLFMADNCSTITYTNPSGVNPSGMLWAGNNYWRGPGRTSCPIAIWTGVTYTSLAAFRTGTGQENGTGFSIDPLISGELGNIIGTIGSSFNATGSGTNLTISSLTAGYVSVGDILNTQTCIPANTTILSQTSGTIGGNGIYVTNNSTTCSNTLSSALSNVFNITDNNSIVLAVGQIIQPSNTNTLSGSIVSQQGGTAGGIGQYLMNVNGRTFRTTVPTSMLVQALGGTCYTSGIPAGPQPCPAPYVLQPTSPMLGTGLDLTTYGVTQPTRDYYGNAIPHAVGTGWNIGADGGNP